MNSTLYDLAPQLVKEWHPSANGILTPITVTIDYSKKLWWICRESHEWQASFKSRLKGNGCPICRKDQPINSQQRKKKSANPKNSHHDIEATPISSGALFKPEVFDDNLGRDFRRSKRYRMKGAAVIESPITGHWVYADVKNFSAGGMGFEIDVCINPGTKVIIKFDRPLFISDQREYDSIIKWCKVSDTEYKSSSPHDIGAQFR